MGVRKKTRRETIAGQRVDLKRHHWDQAAADRAIRFFDLFLVHTKGEWAGHPFHLEEWEADIIRDVWGWRDARGLRMIRNLNIWVARKNGKTTLVAGIGLALCLGDGEPGAEVYSAAADRDQAALVFGQAAEMVQKSPHLAKRCQVMKRAIYVPQTGGIFRVLSSTAGTKHGLNAHGILIDELHAHKTRDLYDVLTTSVGARRQPLTVTISTAGVGQEGIEWEVYRYASQVRDGLIDDTTTLPIIYEVPKDADWNDQRRWREANPNLGVSVKLEYLQTAYAQAVATPEKQNTFRRLHLNQRVEQVTRWIPIEAWDLCKRTDRTLDQMAGRPVFCALDLAAVRDMTAMAYVFPPIPADGPDNQVHRLFVRYFIPEDTIQARYLRDRVPYPTWRDQGHLGTTPGNVTDFTALRAAVQDAAARFDLREIAVDPWAGLQLMNEMMADGMPVVQHRQGFVSYAAPCKAWERMILSQAVAHDGNPVLRWNVGNLAKSEDSAGNQKPDKAKSTERIDGAVAGIMALGRAVCASDTTSVYDTRGLEII